MQKVFSLSLLLVLVISSPAGSPRSLVEAGHFKQARTIAETRLKENPNDAEALWLLSKVRGAYGDFEGAIPLAEKAIAINGRNADYHEQFADMVCQSIDKASMFKQLSLARQCRKELDRALEINPKHPDALQGLALFLWQAPGLAGGDKHKAVEVAKQLEQVDPAMGCILQARLAALDKDIVKATEFYERAVKADPTSYAAQTALANFYAGDLQKKYDLAEMHAREALKNDKSRVKAYNILVRALIYQNRLQEAKDLLAIAAKSIPDNLLPYYAAGNALLAQGKELELAESWLKKYLQQEPEGESPTAAAAQWRLGLVLEKEGKTKEAEEQITAALRAYPNSKEIKSDLKRVKQ